MTASQTECLEPRGQAATILFGHGARDPEWAGPMRRIREQMLMHAPGRRVALAFLEFMSPTLDEAIDALASQDGHVVVVPVFLAQGGHLKRDLPAMLEAARARHRHCRIELATAVGEADIVVAAVAAYALAASDACR